MTPDERRRLFDALLDGSITADQHATLTAELDADESARLAFADYVQLHAALIWQHAEPMSTTPRHHDAPDAAPHRPLRFSRSVGYLAALAAAIAIAAGVSLMFLFNNAAPHTTTPTASLGVAMLSDLSPGARVIDHTHAPTRLGSDLPPGSLTLDTGSAQIAFRSGAVVDLDGPCTFAAAGNNTAVLLNGTLHATVRPEARGFTVNLPGDLRAVDLGTEFDASVLTPHDCRIYVRKGHVRVDHIAPHADAGQSDTPDTWPLTIGRGLIFDPAAPSRPVGYIIGSDASADGTYTRNPGEAETHGPWEGPARIIYDRIGFGGPPPSHTLMMAGLAFALPDLPAGPIDQMLAHAELHIPLLAATEGKPTFNVDLYGLGARPNPRMTATDGYIGASDPNAIRLADNVLHPGVKPGDIVVRGDTLTRYLRTLYGKDGKPLAAYVVFRLNPDQQPAHGVSGYVVGYRENESATQPGPQLILRRQ